MQQTPKTIILTHRKGMQQKQNTIFSHISIVITKITQQTQASSRVFGKYQGYARNTEDSLFHKS